MALGVASSPLTIQAAEMLNASHPPLDEFNPNASRDFFHGIVDRLADEPPSSAAAIILRI